MTYVLAENGVVVDDENGDIIDDAGIPDAVKFAAERRHAAKEQVDQWTALMRLYDRVLLAHLEGKTAYGDIVVAVRQSSYPVFHADQFAADVEGFEATRGELLRTIAAAKGFVADELPAGLRPLAAMATEQRQKRPWIESSIARRVAPRLTTVEEQE